jgi:hypothetical protein
MYNMLNRPGKPASKPTQERLRVTRCHNIAWSATYQWYPYQTLEMAANFGPGYAERGWM